MATNEQLVHAWQKGFPCHSICSAYALLGRQAYVQLDLIRRVEALARSAPATKQDLLQQYSSVFEGLGEFPGEHHICTDPKVPPVIHGCRRIPYSVYDRLKDTLDDLQKRGVISRVTKPTAWVSSLCITEKRNGSLRVCLDPKDLNRAILHQHFSIPTPEDLQGKLAGKTIFTILDEKDSYYQIKLDDESADLCTFNTPWGRYRFHRLPFVIKSASEVFQQTNSEAFGDIEGVSVIADDMIIAAATKTAQPYWPVRHSLYIDDGLVMVLKASELRCCSGCTLHTRAFSAHLHTPGQSCTGRVLAMMYVCWSIPALPARNNCPAIRENRSCRTRSLMLHGRGSRLTSLSSMAGRFY
ncbi:hypothetical protein AAFF_G00116780 [Aldrovandia affinis]|uniref:ribonuclease H n=1 Tax=Aldrovandia affinis TaxID=143900 RepID=A0AAD7T1K5_9TELE|nr:hypothetical protein AAFF_G00116780 [Aldrovandia affinis]